MAVLVSFFGMHGYELSSQCRNSVHSSINVYRRRGRSESVALLFNLSHKSDLIVTQERPSL